MKASILFYPNPLKKSQKNGKIPIYLRVCFKSAKSETRQNAEVNEDELPKWDAVNMRFQGKNLPVNHQLDRIEKKFTDFLILDATTLSHFSATSIKDFLLGNNQKEARKVLSFIDDYFQEAVANNINRMPGTVKNYRRSVNHMINFLTFSK